MTRVLVKCKFLSDIRREKNIHGYARQLYIMVDSQGNNGDI